MSGASDPKSVFLNVPFDKQYERLFVTLVGTIVSLGQVPRCVLEVRERGQGRLARIFDLLRSCGTSIHDLRKSEARFLRKSAREIAAQYGGTLFRPAAFRALVAAATERAQQQGFIAP